MPLSEDDVDEVAGRPKSAGSGSRSITQHDPLDLEQLRRMRSADDAADVLASGGSIRPFWMVKTVPPGAG